MDKLLQRLAGRSSLATHPFSQAFHPPRLIRAEAVIVIPRTAMTPKCFERDCQEIGFWEIKKEPKGFFSLSLFIEPAR